MLNSFLGVETLSRGLYIQTLNQNVTASNLAKTYLDDDGYLMASRQRLEIMQGSPLLFGGIGGVKAIGTGPLLQQVTRLRSAFLDAQIMVESSVLGRAEILTDLLEQIQGVVNGGTGTLDEALTDLAGSFAALAANPLDIALRSDVVNDGVAFATLSRNQFNRLESFQNNVNQELQRTVNEINQILKQLALYNSEILRSQGAQVNDILDARDYALARLSRLVNTQVNYKSNGTVDVFLGSSSFSLVDASGASTVQTNVMNRHNPNLSSITIQSSQGSVWNRDVDRFIRGGNLAGLLEARDVVLEAYKTQVDQVATSVLHVVNSFHRAGYAADGVTTNTAFFTGTGAADINVNASLVADATRALLAASSRVGVTTNGEVAQFIGNVRNLLANNYMTTIPTVGGAINPNAAIATQPFTTIPAGAGSFTVNGVTVNWTNANTVYQILDMINAADPNVHAVFNATQSRFFIFSNNPINIASTSGGGGADITQVFSLNNVLRSTIRMNNGFAPSDPGINFNDLFTPAADDLNSTVPGTFPPGNGPNTTAYQVVPGVGGAFTINGNTVTWDQTQSLATILGNIGAGVYPGTIMAATFDQIPTSSTYQMVTIATRNSPRPIQIMDVTGNFTVFTGLNGNTPIGNLSAGLLGQIDTDLTGQSVIEGQSSASLRQLTTAQANIGAISTVAGEPGVPIQVEQENAIKSLIAFNAALQVMAVINQMYSELVSIISSSGSSNFLQDRA